LPKTRRRATRGRGRHPRRPQFSAGASSADLVHQCARAAEPRGRSPLRSGRHLSQSAVVAAAGGRRAGGAERRVGRRAPLLQSGVHAQTIGADSGGGGASAARAADRIITVEPHAGFYTTSRDVTSTSRSPYGAAASLPSLIPQLAAAGTLSHTGFVCASPPTTIRTLARRRRPANRSAGCRLTTARRSVSLRRSEEHTSELQSR